MCLKLNLQNLGKKAFWLFMHISSLLPTSDCNQQDSCETTIFHTLFLVTGQYLVTTQQLKNPACSAHLWSLIQEWVPYLEKDVTNHAVHKYHKKPVESYKSIVNFVLFKMSMQTWKFLTH